MKLKIVLLEDELGDIRQAADIFQDYLDSCEFHLVYVGKEEAYGTPDIQALLRGESKGNALRDALASFAEIHPFVLPGNAQDNEANELVEEIIQHFLRNEYHLRIFDQQLLPFENYLIPNDEISWNGADILVQLLNRELDLYPDREPSEVLLYTDASADPNAALARLFGRVQNVSVRLQPILLSQRTKALSKDEEEFEKWLRVKIEGLTNRSLTNIYSRLWSPRQHSWGSKYGLYQVTHDPDSVTGASKVALGNEGDLIRWWQARISQARKDCEVLDRALHYDEERRKAHQAALEEFFSELEGYLRKSPPQIPFTDGFQHGGEIDKFKKGYRFSADCILGRLLSDVVEDILREIKPGCTIQWDIKKNPGFYAKVDEIEGGLAFLLKSIVENGQPTKIDFSVENNGLLVIRDDSTISMERAQFFSTGNKMNAARKYLRGYCRWTIKSSFGPDGPIEHCVYDPRQDSNLESAVNGVEHRLVFDP